MKASAPREALTLQNLTETMAAQRDKTQITLFLLQESGWETEL